MTEHRKKDIEHSNTEFVHTLEKFCTGKKSTKEPGSEPKCIEFDTELEEKEQWVTSCF
jgi:hypothetical protein